MHDLIPADLLPPGTLSTIEIEAALGFAEAAKAASTIRSYSSDWRSFATWCAAHDACPLPAHAGILSAYLAYLAGAGRKASSIGRAVAAIADRHRAAGYEPATGHAGVRAVMRGIRRTLGTAPERKVAATADLIAQMVKCIPADTLKGKRDKALLLIGFAAAMRRSELVAIEVADLTETEDGIRLRIRRSKTDQEGLGAEVPVLRGTRLRPVAAVREWMAAAAISSGPVFRPVRGDLVRPYALRAADVPRIVKTCAERAGLDAAMFSGHSLRAGFCTSSAEAGASIFSIMTVSRHKSVDVLTGYVRQADLFKGHAGAAFL